MKEASLVGVLITLEETLKRMENAHAYHTGQIYEKLDRIEKLLEDHETANFERFKRMHTRLDVLER